jgi:hypothetical protein
MVLRNENYKKSAWEGRDDRFVGTSFFVLDNQENASCRWEREKVEA